MASNEKGFSLIEVIVAMFLLAVIALAILPLAVSTVALSVDNRSMVAANTLAGAHLARFRSVFPNDGVSGSCTSAAALARVVAGEDPVGAALPITILGVADPAGTGLSADITLAQCPSTFPSTVKFTISVREPGTSSPLTIVHTNILVTAP